MQSCSLRRLRRSAFFGASLMILGLSDAHAQTASPRDTVVARIALDYPCKTVRFKLVHAQSGPLPEHSCSIARYAASRFASDSARRLGITSADTAAIMSAAIAYFSFEDLSGGPPERYWSVSFHLAGRSLPVVVRVDQTTGMASIANGEGRPEPY